METMNLVPFPPRAALRPPEPAPQVGRQRESLISFTRRSCEVNQLSFSDVIMREILPSRGMYERKGVSALRGVVHQVNNDSEVSRIWGEALCNLMRPFDFSSMTLASLENVQGLGRMVCSRHKRWCPACYEEDAERSHGPYERLVWCIELVKVCPEHGVLLVERCPGCQRSNFQAVTGQDISGFCSHCKAWLGGRGMTVEPDRDVHAKYLLWTAEAFGALLNFTFEEPFDASKNISSMLGAVARDHFTGRADSMARALDRAKSTMSYWMNGRSCPTWDALAAISFAFHLPVISLIRGEIDAVAVAVVRPLPHAIVVREPRKRSQVYDPLRLYALVDQMRAGAHPSVRTVEGAAQFLGPTARQIREKDRQGHRLLVDLISERKRQFRDAKRHRNAVHQDQEIRRFVQAAAAMGAGLSRRKLYASLKTAGVPVPWKDSAQVLKNAKDLYELARSGAVLIKVDAGVGAA